MLGSRLTGFKVLAVAALPAAMLLAACGGGTSSSGVALNFTMTIGDVEPFTGDLSALGAPADKAVTLAVDQLNKASKDAGLSVTFKLVSADTQTDPQAALSAARKVIDEGATCLTGPATTPESLAILNGVTKARKITMLPSATAAKLRLTDDGGTIFRTAPPDNLQAMALVTAVQAQLGSAQGKTVSIGYQNSPYGEGLANTFKDAWTKLGGKIQGPVGYDPTQPSYNSEAAKILANNPDAYVFADFPDTFGKVAAALLRTGNFDPSKLFVSDALAVSPIPSTIPAAALNGAHATNAGSPLGTPQAADFDKLYTSAPGPGRFALDDNNFDSGILCGLAAIAAGSNDPAAINAQIRKISGPTGQEFTFTKLGDAMKALRAGTQIHYMGVSGAIDFDAKGDTSTGTFDLSTWKNGQLVLDRKIDTKP
ncbi:MAG TPA: ABC transporter substrate-binding protein [Candidatus Micrarchaeaceae archaeon]|nr:ABC transporter substrate-binding protein [Candidatus Micrarchaeaceae archaeon]